MFYRKKIEDKIREAKEKVRETKRDFLEKQSFLKFSLCY